MEVARRPEARAAAVAAAVVAAGVAVAAVVHRWRSNGTLDDLLERCAFQIWRYAQKYELRCRPKRIFLLRHGESEGNIDKTVSCAHVQCALCRRDGVSDCAWSLSSPP